MKSKLKMHFLKMLSENLEMFHPELKGCFMCPTCLSVVKYQELSEISEAHIVPKAAGGKLKTFLCKKCNSSFGAKQDKWFGEIIRISNNKKASIFSTAIKDGFFFLDDIKVNGHWKENEDGSFSFYIHNDRNHPDVNRIIKEKFGNNPPQMNLKIPMPLLKNQNLIHVGYLTAAFLMWFGLLGYSWALQEHLNGIRRQILNPESDLLDPKYVFKVESANWNPWIGLVTLYGDTVPAFGLKKHMVVMPPRCKPTYYDSLKKAEGSINMSDIKALKLPDKPFYGPPVSILFEKQLVVFAKPCEEAIEKVHCILFTGDSDHGRIMTHVDQKRFNRLKKMKNAKNINIKVPTV